MQNTTLQCTETNQTCCILYLSPIWWRHTLVLWKRQWLSNGLLVTIWEQLMFAAGKHTQKHHFIIFCIFLPSKQSEGHFLLLTKKLNLRLDLKNHWLSIENSVHFCHPITQPLPQLYILRSSWAKQKTYGKTNTLKTCIVGQKAMRRGMWTKIPIIWCASSDKTKKGTLEHIACWVEI